MKRLFVFVPAMLLMACGPSEDDFISAINWHYQKERMQRGGNTYHGLQVDVVSFEEVENGAYWVTANVSGASCSNDHPEELAPSPFVYEARFYLAKESKDGWKVTEVQMIISPADTSNTE